VSVPADLEAFVRVVERQSFAAAAAALKLTPSAVSKLVSRLEDSLGVRLLLRTTRRLALTSEGDVYFARARQNLSVIEEANVEVAKLRAAPRGRLHINMSSGFGVHQLAPALPDFLTRYPDIEVKLSITDRIVDLVLDYADVTIRAGRIDDTKLTARKIAEYKRTICAAPAYLARHGAPRRAVDLTEHTCILTEFHAPYCWTFRIGAGVEEIRITPHVITDSSEAALRLAIEGVGIVRLGDPIVSGPIAQGQLVPLLTDVHHSEAVALSALYLPGRHRLPKVRVFLDFLAERFSSAPWIIQSASQRGTTGPRASLPPAGKPPER
jgi:DNA-binding transcriptional LysR family regulator